MGLWDVHGLKIVNLLLEKGEKLRTAKRMILNTFIMQQNEKLLIISFRFWMSSVFFVYVILVWS